MTLAHREAHAEHQVLQRRDSDGATRTDSAQLRHARTSTKVLSTNPPTTVGTKTPSTGTREETQRSGVRSPIPIRYVPRPARPDPNLRSGSPDRVSPAVRRDQWPGAARDAPIEADQVPAQSAISSISPSVGHNCWAGCRGECGTVECRISAGCSPGTRSDKQPKQRRHTR